MPLPCRPPAAGEVEWPDGSGRRGGCSARHTTDDCRAMDVRRWQREKWLASGYFNMEWKRCDHALASMIVCAEADRVYLIYRYRISSEEWRVKASLCASGLGELPLRWAASLVSVPELRTACGDPPRQRHHRLPPLLRFGLLVHARRQGSARRTTRRENPRTAQMATMYCVRHGREAAAHALGHVLPTFCPSRGVGDGSVRGLVARAWHQT